METLASTVSSSSRLFPSTILHRHRSTTPPSIAFHFSRNPSSSIAASTFKLKCSSSAAFNAISTSPAAAATDTGVGAGDKNDYDEDRAKFIEASKNGCNLIPLHRCIFSDHLTPVVAYRCLVKEDDRDAPSFLFESVEQGSGRTTNTARYSFVGAQPAMEIVAKENLVSIMDHEEGKRTQELVDDPMQIPQDLSQGWNPHLPDDLPDVFCGTML